MKPTPIKIPDMHSHAARALDAARTSANARNRYCGIMLANRRESSFERPALRGIACRYNVPFEYDGQLTVLLPGCFAGSLEAVELLLEHDDKITLASSGLRFVDGPDFLSFEFEMPATQQGALITSLVASGSRTDTSVGARNLQTTTRSVKGHEIRFVTSGELRELSLCVDGAIPSSHARVVDLGDSALSLADEMSAGILDVWSKANDLHTATRRLRNKVSKLTSPAQRSYPVHHQW